MTIDRLLRYIQLKKHKLDLEQQLKEVNHSITLAETNVSNFLQRKGVNKYSTSEGTIYFSKHVHATLLPNPDGSLSDAIACLRSHNLGHLVTETVLPQDLRTWAQQVDASKQQLPQTLREHVAISRKYTVNLRS